MATPPVAPGSIQQASRGGGGRGLHRAALHPCKLQATGPAARTCASVADCSAPRRLQLPKAPEQFENETDAVWAALLQGRWGHREEGLRPVFVVGLPRSGARLLERTLTRHPQASREAWGLGAGA